MCPQLGQVRHVGKATDEMRSRCHLVGQCVNPNMGVIWGDMEIIPSGPDTVW